MESHQTACWVAALTSATHRLATAAEPLLPWFSREWGRVTAPTEHGSFCCELRSDQVLVYMVSPDASGVSHARCMATNIVKQ